MSKKPREEKGKNPRKNPWNPGPTPNPGPSGSIIVGS
jgi:hypothetical protein